jgi:hypothetical protein
VRTRQDGSLVAAFSARRATRERIAEAAERLGAKIEDEDLDGLAEAVEVRETLEHLQAPSLEVSE